MPTSTIGEMFRRTAIARPNAEALVDLDTGRRLSFDELRSHLVGLEGALRDVGVGRGDTFATVLRNSAEMTAALLVASRMGATVNTVNYRQSMDAVTHIVTDSGARAVLFDEPDVDLVEAVRDDLDTVDAYLYTGDDPPPYADSYWDRVAANADGPTTASSASRDDPYYLVYTSGTTGKPKGCLHLNGSVMEQCYMIMSEERLTPESRTLVIAPQAHIAGAWEQGIPTLLRGGTALTMRTFDPARTLTAIEDEAITHLFAVPAMWKALVDAADGSHDLSSIEGCQTAGAPLSSHLARRVVDTFAPDRFFNLLGSSEAFNVTNHDVTADLENADSPGSVYPNVEIRVVELDAGDPDAECDVGETGELVVRSPFVMERYLNLPEENAASFVDGWFFMGDTGYLDEDGYFWHAGRKSNLIITGGENVSDVYVENVLIEHPSIDEVAVIGLPDDTWGERVVACVVPDPDGDLTADDVLAWAADRRDLAGYERPKSVVIMDELPRSAAMKVQKFELRERLSDGE